MVSMEVRPGEFVSRHLRKACKGHGMYDGIVLAYNPRRCLYDIGYTDLDSEETIHDMVLQTIYEQTERMKRHGNTVEQLSIRSDLMC